MPEPFNPTRILQHALPSLGCTGALLALSEDDAVTTYSAGSITPSDHERAFYIYSISKTFTAVALMKLCEDRGNFLDQPFASFFPEAPIPPTITVRQLLNHTAGLSDYFSSVEYQEAVRCSPSKPWSYPKLMRIGLSRTPLFDPGNGWSYSNPGYGLLRELIEKLSGTDYYSFLDQVIVQKAALSQTRPFIRLDEKLELLEAEETTFDGDFRAEYHPGWIATGCLISTVQDVARFYDALFGGRLLSATSLSEMTKTVEVLKQAPKGNIPTYGLGLMHFRRAPLGDAYGHGGGGPGYTTYATHYPNLRGHSVSISLVLNKSLPQTPFDLAEEIAREYVRSNDG